MVMWKWSSYGSIKPKKILSQNAVGTCQQRRGCIHLMGRSKNLTEDAQDPAPDTNTAPHFPQPHQCKLKTSHY